MEISLISLSSGGCAWDSCSSKAAQASCIWAAEGRFDDGDFVNCWNSIVDFALSGESSALSWGCGCCAANRVRDDGTEAGGLVDEFGSRRSSFLKVALDNMSAEVGYMLGPRIRGAMSSKEVGSESIANTIIDLAPVRWSVTEL